MDDSKEPDDMEGDDASPSVLGDEELFLRLKDWFKASSEAIDPWREQAREDYAFRAGDQWSDEEKKVLKDQLRPVVTFNRIDPVVDAVAGTEVSNRQEVHYLPRTEGDVQANEVYTGAAKWFRDQCDAEDEESDAFQDVLTVGIGWTETRLDYEEDEEGAPVVDRIDPFEMYPDPGARKRNFEDGRYVFRVREIDEEDAEAMLPGVDCEDMDAAWAIGEKDGSDESAEEARFYRSNGDPIARREKGKVTLVECQWFERQSIHLVADPNTGEIAPMDDASFKKYAQRFTELGGKPQSVTMTKRIYHRAYLGKRLLLKEVSPFQGHFSYKAITGKRDRNKKIYYGLVRQMKDPQRWANKWLSQTMHIMNVNAKGGIMAEDGVAEDMREFERTWARPDAVTRVKAGTLSGPNGPKVQPKPTAQFPAGFFSLLEFAISSVRDASGVNLELLGMVDREQAGILEAQRKKAAMAILATMFDSLRRYRKSQGRLLLQIINEHLSDGRLIRIVGEEGEKYVPLIRQEGVTQYDVKVDDAPSSPHQREMTWAMLMQIIPAVRDQMTPDMWAAIIPYSPLPSSVTGKLQKMIADGAEGAAKQGQAVQQLEMAERTANVKKTEAEAMLKAEQAKVEAASKEQDVQIKQMEVVQKKLEFEMRKMEAQAKAAEMSMGEIQGPDPLDMEERQVKIEQAKIDLEERRAAREHGDRKRNLDETASQLNVMDAQERAAHAQAINQAVSGLSDVVSRLVDGQQMTQEMIAGMARAITAPKRIVKGPDGKPAGVETVMN